MTIQGYLALWRDLQNENHLYFPVGHVNQDCHENFFAGLRWNGGHRTNPSAADIPSAFLRSFVKFLTCSSKKKNCKDDAAVMLLDFEEIYEELKKVENAKQPSNEEIVLNDMDDVTDLILQMEEQQEVEEGLQMQVERHSTDESPSDSTLRLSASLKAATPTINTFLAKLKCSDCKEILLTEATFPDHLFHTLVSTAASVNEKLPVSAVGHVLKQIYEVGIPTVKETLHQPGCVSNFVKVCNRLPSVRQLKLCANHECQKESLVKELCVASLTDTLRKMSTEYAEKHRTVTQSLKMQRVKHL